MVPSKAKGVIKSKIWLELRVGIAFAYHSCNPAGKFVQQENAPAAPSQLTESFGGSVPSLLVGSDLYGRLAVICVGPLPAGRDLCGTPPCWQ